MNGWIVGGLDGTRKGGSCASKTASARVAPIRGQAAATEAHMRRRTSERVPTLPHAQQRGAVVDDFARHIPSARGAAIPRQLPVQGLRADLDNNVTQP